MFFIFSLALALLQLSLAAPILHSGLAPIRRAIVFDVGGHSTIVAIKPGTIVATKEDRLDFITVALSAANLLLDDSIKSTLILDWSEDVFNGFAGQFSDRAVEVLRKRSEVAWVQAG